VRIQATMPPTRRPGIPEAVKLVVHRRDGGRCAYCGSSELLQFDHIIPVSMGGNSEVANLQLACSDCNRRKAGRLHDPAR